MTQLQQHQFTKLKRKKNGVPKALEMRECHKVESWKWLWCQTENNWSEK